MSIETAYDNWAKTYDSDNNLTRDLDKTVTQEILKNKQYQSIIEIGCGTGKNTLFLSQIAKQVQAIDFSENMINQAKAKADFSNVEFYIGDITQEWMFADNSADLVTCNLILEHIENLEFIFTQAERILIDNGHLFICELHPFRQYQGGKASFYSNQEIIEISAFTHHVSDFVNLAKNCGFQLEDLQEWWHEQDENKPPRLISFVFKK